MVHNSNEDGVVFMNSDHYPTISNDFTASLCRYPSDANSNQLFM